MQSPIQFIHQPSENCFEQRIKPNYIILHCVGYDENFVIDHFSSSIKNNGFGAAAHYFIPQHQQQSNSNRIYHFVPINSVKDNYQADYVASHAGQCYWHGNTNFNEQSIGIEIHMPNYAHALTHPNQLNFYYFENFKQEQIKTLILLIEKLMATYAIPAENILGHSDIAPWRIFNNEVVLGKTDPTAAVPWKELAQQGIGVWPQEQRTRNSNLDCSIENTKYLLRQAGYRVTNNNALDIATRYSIMAFALHFLPDSHKALINIDNNEELTEEHILKNKLIIPEQMIIYLENLVDRKFI